MQQTAAKGSYRKVGWNWMLMSFGARILQREMENYSTFVLFWQGGRMLENERLGREISFPRRSMGTNDKLFDCYGYWEIEVDSSRFLLWGRRRPHTPCETLGFTLEKLRFSSLICRRRDSSPGPGYDAMVKGWSDTISRRFCFLLGLLSDGRGEDKIRS